MPRLSFLAVRLALIYLLLGFTLGAVMLANEGISITPRIEQLLPVHVEFLLIGFIVQLAMGVAFWILPRFTGGSRGNIKLAWLAIITLNIGVLLVSFQVLPGVPLAVLLLGRFLECTAGISFVLNAWVRVKPFSAA